MLSSRQRSPCSGSCAPLQQRRLAATCVGASGRGSSVAAAACSGGGRCDGGCTTCVKQRASVLACWLCSSCRARCRWCVCVQASRSDLVSVWGVLAVGSQLPSCRLVRPAHGGGVLVRLCCFCLCVGGGCARRLHVCMQCVPLACPGVGTGWFVPGSVSVSGALQRRAIAYLHTYNLVCATLSLCACRQLRTRVGFGMLQLGRWGQPPVMQVCGLNP